MKREEVFDLAHGLRLNYGYSVKVILHGKHKPLLKLRKLEQRVPTRLIPPTKRRAHA
jgi:hypothetical protein